MALQRQSPEKVSRRKARRLSPRASGEGEAGEQRGDQATPTPNPSRTEDYSLRVRAVALGRAHTHVLSYDGELYACGCNAVGQLGVGSLSRTACPAAIAQIDKSYFAVICFR